MIKVKTLAKKKATFHIKNCAKIQKYTRGFRCFMKLKEPMSSGRQETLLTVGKDLITGATTK